MATVYFFIYTIAYKLNQTHKTVITKRVKRTNNAGHEMKKILY